MFSRLRFGPRVRRNAAALALDLTTEAIILNERTPQGDWKKFASVRLDDSEFPVVIGLLRDEAEAHSGKPQPVRLWLPGEQVLKLQARISGRSQGARLRASFNYIDKETDFRSGNVAIAVAPAGQNGVTTILVTFAETWREAMDCAARWGFIPGVLSTRHHSADFGADGPVFHLKTPPPGYVVPVKRRRVAVAALSTIAVVGIVAIWSLAPWGQGPGELDQTPGSLAIDTSKPPSVTPEPQIGQLTAPEPAPPIAAEPPRHFPISPVPNAPQDLDQTPKIYTASKAPDLLAPAIAIAPPTELPAAPSPPPRLEPEPLQRDPVVRNTGQLVALKSPQNLPPPVLLANIISLTPLPDRHEKISFTAINASWSRPPEPLPIMELPPAAPVGTSIESIKPVAPEPAAPVIAPASTGQVEWSEPGDMLASAAPNTPVSPPEPIWMVPPYPAPVPLQRPQRADPNNPGAPTIFASTTSPLPSSRPRGFAAARRVTAPPAILPPLTSTAVISAPPVTTEPGAQLDPTMLVGILSFEDGRKALLRLPDGSYRFVIVGDVLDGWRVSLIGSDAMRITRSGEDRTLLLVNR